jgi:hypothetical protein
VLTLNYLIGPTRQRRASSPIQTSNPYNIPSWLSYRPIGKYIHLTGLTEPLGNLGGVFQTYINTAIIDAIDQSIFNQSEDSSLLINQLNPKISSYPTDIKLETLGLICSKSLEIDRDERCENTARLDTDLRNECPLHIKDNWAEFFQ